MDHLPSNVQQETMQKYIDFTGKFSCYTTTFILFQTTASPNSTVEGCAAVGVDIERFIWQLLKL